MQKALEGMMEKVAKMQPPLVNMTDKLENDTRNVEPTVEETSRVALKKITSVPGLIIHSNSSKKTWSISPKPEVRILVIGDSNLRGVASVPPSWEIHVLPGARIGHVLGACTQLLNRKPHALKTVFVQVGVNHRDDTSPPFQQMNILAEKLSASGIEAAFVGVSYDSKLPGRQRMQLDELNLAAKNCFKIYVPPLHPRDVMIQRGDRYGIHYDLNTVCRIMANVEATRLSMVDQI
jgi:hypothetical protein